MRNARAAGLLVDHYFFNGRAATPTQVAQKIIDTYDGVKIETGEKLWWDVESEGSMGHWTPAEVATYAWALSDAGIPLGRQGIYLSSSVTRQDDWLGIAKIMPLWVADYGVNSGSVSSRPLVGFWGAPNTKPIELFQYTSVGKLPGYDGNLDLNITGEDVWTVYDLQVALNSIEELGLSLDEDGIWGRNTSVGVSKYQELRGLAVDGVAGYNTLGRLEGE